MLEFYKFALPRMNRKAKIIFWSMFPIALVSSIVSILIPVVQKNLILGITNGKLDREEIIKICLIIFIGIIVNVLEALGLNKLMICLKRKIQQELLNSGIRNDNPIIRDKGAGAYMVSIFGDSEQISGLIQNNVFYIFFQVVAAIVVLIITLNWSMLFAAIVIPSYIIMIAIHILSNKLYLKKYEIGREYVYEVNPKTLEYIENRSTILGYAQIQSYENNLYQLFDKRDASFEKAFAINTVSLVLLKAVKTISLLLFFIFSLYEILKESMTVAEFVAMTTYFSTIYAPIEIIKQFYMQVHKYHVAKSKIEDSLKKQIRSGIPKDYSLQLYNCSYMYKDIDTKGHLDNVTINVNDKIALVGLSGEGKTTIIKMLLGEIIPNIGRCVCGTQDISRISKYILRTYIRYYSQNIEIFNEDLCFNIALGKKGVDQKEYINHQQSLISLTGQCLIKIKNKCSNKQLSDDEKHLIQEVFLSDVNECSEYIFNDIIGEDNQTIETCAQIIGECVTARRYYINEKYNDILNMLELNVLKNRKLGQRGDMISGGEKNKIAMARFLLPEYGRYFILDEPFTNLDLISEEKCMNALRFYTKDMNGILISHKMNIVRNFANQIYVLENGKITDKGIHQELINKSGLYKKLYEEYLNQTNIETIKQQACKSCPSEQ